MTSFRACATAKMPATPRPGMRALAHLALTEQTPAVSARKVLSHVRTGREIAAERIKHVFVLMLENRSFDHMFGFWDLVGLDPVSGQWRPADTLKVSALNTGYFPNGESVPVFASPGAAYQLAGDHEDPAHEFRDVLKQMCGQAGEAQLKDGRLTGPYPAADMSGFVQAFIDGEARDDLAQSENKAGTAVPMRSFERSKLPVLGALAEGFALCDHWHAALPGPTLPNRIFAHAASSADYDDSPDNGAVMSSGIGLSAGVRLKNGTIYSRLEDAGLKWRIYSDDAPFMATTNFLDGVWAADISALEDLEEDLAEDEFDAAYIFIEPNYALFSGDPGAYGGNGNSMHPVGDVRLGEDLIASVYKAIRNSRRWHESVLLVVFDEHGGFHDHVRPPRSVAPGDSSPSTAKNNTRGFQFDSLGPRVPALVISPYVAHGVTDRTVYEHSSLPAAIERRFGLDPMTARDAAASDFWHLLTLEEPRQDTPTEFAEHPSEDAVSAAPAKLKRDGTQTLSSAHGVAPMIAGAQLKELKARTTELEYRQWEARLDHSVTLADLQAGIGQAQTRLRTLAPTVQLSRRPFRSP